LAELLVRFSQLVVEQRWIKEIDINPLLASPDQLLALEARVIVYGLEVTAEQLPRYAIRPYPIQYVSPWTMKNGETITIRPIRPEDEPLMVEFHQKLSERTVYLRYSQPLKLSQRVAHERLCRICFTDYDREMVLLREHKGKGGAPEVVAVGRLSKLHRRDDWLSSSTTASNILALEPNCFDACSLSHGKRICVACTAPCLPKIARCAPSVGSSDPHARGCRRRHRARPARPLEWAP
jgi:hypothetical protein